MHNRSCLTSLIADVRSFAYLWFSSLIISSARHGIHDAHVQFGCVLCNRGEDSPRRYSLSLFLFLSFALKHNGQSNNLTRVARYTTVVSNLPGRMYATRRINIVPRRGYFWCGSMYRLLISFASVSVIRSLRSLDDIKARCLSPEISEKIARIKNIHRTYSTSNSRYLFTQL